MVAAATRADTAAAYYALCTEYPYFTGLKKTPYRSILEATKGILPLAKLSGPGTVLELEELPEGLSLKFILQGGGMVETDFRVGEHDAGLGSTFAILCNEAVKHAGLPEPNPAYPRPFCASAPAFVDVFLRLRQLAVGLHGATRNAAACRSTPTLGEQLDEDSLF